MASFQLTASSVFPAGVTVKVWPWQKFVLGIDYGAAPPASAPTAEGTFDGTSMMVEGLQEATWYVAGAVVGGKMAYVRFLTRKVGEDEGPAGPQGIQGPRGDEGPPGPSVTGPVGGRGETGPVGATGAAGAAGAKGAEGVQGVQGPEGPAGAVGAAGPTGVKGTTGSTGAAGATGATGAKGVQGEAGATGATGAAGAAGESFSVAAPVSTAAITSGTPFRPRIGGPCMLKVLATLSGLLGSGLVTVSLCSTEGGTYVEAGRCGVVLATGVELGSDDCETLVPTGFYVKVVVTGVATGNVALSGVRWDL